jgi:hypothetical protein
MILDKEFDRDIIIYAFRYTLGRHSYAPGLMRGKLDEIWDQISQGDKTLILREIEEHAKFIGMIYDGKTMTAMDTYDLNEWLVWRERKMIE